MISSADTCTTKQMVRLNITLDSLQLATEMADLRAAMDALCVNLRFRHAAFLVTRAGLEAPVGMFLANYPSHWVCAYVDRNYFAIDPVISMARTAFLPFEWASLESASGGSRAFFEEARSYSLGQHGISVPTRAQNGERSVFSVTSDLPEPDWRYHRAKSLDNLVTFARHFHERFSLISGLRTASAPRPMSPREQQCLKLLAQGLLTKQIAGALQISESAVRQYLRSAKSKLASRTLAQAMSRAALLDLLQI